MLCRPAVPLPAPPLGPLGSPGAPVLPPPSSPLPVPPSVPPSAPLSRPLSRTAGRWCARVRGPGATRPDARAVRMTCRGPAGARTTARHAPAARCAGDVRPAGHGPPGGAPPPVRRVPARVAGAAVSPRPRAARDRLRAPERTRLTRQSTRVPASAGRWREGSAAVVMSRRVIDDRPERTGRHGTAYGPPDRGEGLFGSRLFRDAAHDDHGESRPDGAVGRTRHVPESPSGSGTLCEMRVVPRAGRPGVARAAAPDPAVRAAVHEVGRPVSPMGSIPGDGRRTVCRTGTPSRGNMPEALVAVTVRQPCCLARESQSVTLALAVVLAMQRMAVLADPARCGVAGPPVRMV